MAATAPEMIDLRCPGCNSLFRVPPSMAGRRGKCAACGAVVVIPPADLVTTDKAKPDDTPIEPQYVAVECRVCQTRMHGRVDQVGQPLKCPDCGARTVVPPPPPPKAKNIPAALEGEQYELWDAEDQPLPSQLIAVQPRFIAVQCHKCDTLMYAGENQVGQTISCPDCGMKHTVPPPAKPAPVRSVLATDAETPVLDPAAAPGDWPAVVVSTTDKMLYEREHEAELAEAAVIERRTGRKLYDAKGHPVVPRWPLIQGIIPFLFHRDTRTRWMGFALGLLLAGGLLLEGVVTWATWIPQPGNFLGGMEAMAGLAEMLIGTVLMMVWLAAAASSFLTIVSESAEGNHKIYAWPAVNFIDSMPDLLTLVVAILFSLAPGWAIGQLANRETWEVLLWTAGSLLICFPVIYLSQQAAASPWALVDRKVLGGMLRCPFSVLLFYLESALIGFLCTAAAAWSATIHYLLPIAFAPLYIAAAILYGRLLGRLAWRLSEATARIETAT